MDLLYPGVVRFALGLFKAQGITFTRIGAENIPRTGGAVIALNHIGYLDFAYAGYPAYDRGRLVRFMAKKEVFDHKISGPLMRGMKHIPVDRSAGAAAYRAAVTALRRGELVGVFPEATISRSFELKEFKGGAVRMAQEAGVPVIPMVVWGSQRVWTKDHDKRLGRTNVPVTLIVGEPMHVAADTSTEEATAALKATMAGLLQQAQESYPPMTGEDLVYLPARMGGTAPTPQAAVALEAQEAAARAARRAGRAEH